jgi:hypothetical protein
MSHAVEDDMDERLPKLGTDVAHIRVSVGELKAEIAMKDGLTGQVAALHVDMVMTRVWMLCTSAALLGVMARGFHWV